MSSHTFRTVPKPVRFGDVKQIFAIFSEPSLKIFGWILANTSERGFALTLWPATFRQPVYQVSFCVSLRPVSQMYVRTYRRTRRTPGTAEGTSRPYPIRRTGTYAWMYEKALFCAVKFVRPKQNYCIKRPFRAIVHFPYLHMRTKFVRKIFFFTKMPFAE